MDLRPELLPPPVSPQHLAEISRHIDEITESLLRSDPVTTAIARFNDLTGHDYDATDFAEYQG